MWKVYRDILQTPGAPAFVAAACVGRLPAPMFALSFVLLITATTGSYALAGAVAGATAIASAVAGPQVGRLVDRFGQRRTLLPVIGVNVTATASLVATIVLELPQPLILLAAAAAGAATLQLGSLSRARWATLIHERDRLQTAFALESAVDELTFTIGPVLATAVVAAIAPVAGPLTIMLLTLVGGLAFAALRGTEPPPVRRRAGGRAAIRSAGMCVLVAVFVALGIAFGTLEVALVAFSEERGHPVAAGPLLALYALASGVAGIAYGARRWGAPLQRRLQVAVVLLGIGTIPVALADSLPVMALAMVLCGATNAPILIAGYGIIESLVPRSAMTEGFAWLTTSMLAGASLGLTLTGQVVEATGGRTAFLTMVAATATAALIVAAGLRHLAPRSAAS